MPHDLHREIAIQCVAELGRAVTILDREIQTENTREIKLTIVGMRLLLDMLDKATTREAGHG